KFIHWDEFVENSVIKHQQHFIAAGLVLNPKKSFGCIINFIVIDVLPNDITVLLTVGFKADTAMKKHLQIRPQFTYTALSCICKNPLEQYQHPAGHAGQTSYIFISYFGNNSLQLTFPLGHE